MTYTIIDKRKAIKALEAGESIENILSRFNISAITLEEWKSTLNQSSSQHEKMKKKEDNGLPDMDFKKLLGCG